MTVSTDRLSSRSWAPGKWLGVGVLALFMLVNFWDRAVLGLAAVPIMRDMHLSHAEFGLLGSAFFALFSVAALLVGWLGDRWPARGLLAGMALLWSIAQAIPVVTTGFAAFLFSRVLLGAGEGSAFPTALHTAYDWFPNTRRPLITAIIASGAPLGVASSAFFVTWIIAALGWRGAFGILSALSLVWCAGWMLASGTRLKSAPANAPRALPLIQPSPHFFISPTMIGATITAFAVYWMTALTVIWLPPALEVGAGMTPENAGFVLTIAWLCQVPVFLCSGWVSESLQRQGHSSEVARGALAAAGLAVSGAAMVGLALTLTRGGWMMAVAAALCLGATAVVITCVPPIVGEVARANNRGRALGVWIAISATGGIIAPLAFGRIVDISEGVTGYRMAFLLSGALVVVVAIASRFLTRPSRDG